MDFCATLVARENKQFEQVFIMSDCVVSMLTANITSSTATCGRDMNGYTL